LSTEQYQSALIVELLCWSLNRMLYGDSLQELALSKRVVSMGIRRSTHLQERDQVLLMWGRSLVFRWHLRVSAEGVGVVTQITLRIRDCLSTVENMAEKAQSRLDEILTEAA
jgi:hypothetical protein